VDIEPPTFVFFCTDPKAIHFSYRRYLENQLREQFAFTGTPIRISFRGREDADL
jgi:GTP-binding protein